MKYEMPMAIVLITYRSSALDHISAIILASLQSEQLPGAFVFTKFIQFFFIVILAEHSAWNIYGW